MTRITIVGSGVVGMAIASVLSKEHEVTIVARDLPGDVPSTEWASPWAGSSFIAGGLSLPPREQKMQLDTFPTLWHWSEAFPESSLRRIILEDFFDEEDAAERVWWKNAVPKFKFLPHSKLPPRAKVGISYKTVVLRPDIFLPWMRHRLEESGVQIKRMTIDALTDVKHLGHDVLINASGLGPRTMTDVADVDVRSVRGQTIVIKSDYDTYLMHDDGINYTYVIPRLDGTAILGGIRQPGSTDAAVDAEVSKDIVRRVHELRPEKFSSNISDYDIIGYNVGMRTGRSSGPRVEKEVKNGQNVIHAYGFEGGGYIYSFGAALMVKDMVNEFISTQAHPDQPTL